MTTFSYQRKPLISVVIEIEYTNSRGEHTSQADQGWFASGIVEWMFNDTDLLRLLAKYILRIVR